MGRLYNTEVMEMIVEQFIEIVNRELENQEMSRSALAREMGVTPQTVNSYLQGKVKPGPDMIEKFFAALSLVPRLEFDPKREKISA